MKGTRGRKRTSLAHTLIVTEGEVPRLDARLVNEMAHDLCTPMTSIGIQLHLLRLKAPTSGSPLLADSVEIIDRNYVLLRARVAAWLQRLGGPGILGALYGDGTQDSGAFHY